MKKLLFISLFVLSSSFVLADDCENPNTSGEVNECLNADLKSQKSEMNKLFNKIYKTTDAKAELTNAQKAWLSYQDLQCGDFISTATGHSPATTTYSLICIFQLNDQRIEYLKTVLEEF